LWGRRDTQVVIITSVTEVIEVTGYRLWRGVLREANVAPTAASSSCHSPKRSLVMCTPPEARGSLLRDCNHLWRVRPPHRDTGRIKAPFAGTICSTPFLRLLLFEHGRDPQPSAWKVNSQKFVGTEFSEVRLLRGHALRCGSWHHTHRWERFDPLGA
jgi:hypothetical protein